VTMRAVAGREALVRASDDDDPGLAIPAVVGAALLGDRASLGRLPQLLRRGDLPPALRRDALIALAKSQRRDAAPKLATLLRREKDIYRRIELIEVLGQLGDARATPALREQLATLRTRLYAIVALGEVGARKAVPELLSAIQRDRFVSWRKAAAVALGRIGDRRAVAPLKRHLARELEAPVVTAVLEALARLAALPAPTRWLQVLRFDAERWRCEGKRCLLESAVSCEGGAELLAIFDAAGSLAPLTVRCGAARVGRLAPATAAKDRGAARGRAATDEGRGRAVAAMARLPAKVGRATLILESRTGRPRLRFVGLRRVSRSAGRGGRNPRAARVPPARRNGGRSDRRP